MTDEVPAQQQAERTEKAEQGEREREREGGSSSVVLGDAPSGMNDTWACCPNGTFDDRRWSALPLTKGNVLKRDSGHLLTGAGYCACAMLNLFWLTDKPT